MRPVNTWKVIWVQFSLWSCASLPHAPKVAHFAFKTPFGINLTKLATESPFTFAAYFPRESKRSCESDFFVTIWVPEKKNGSTRCLSYPNRQMKIRGGDGAFFQRSTFYRSSSILCHHPHEKIREEPVIKTRPTLIFQSQEVVCPARKEAPQQKTTYQMQ